MLKIKFKSIRNQNNDNLIEDSNGMSTRTFQVESTNKFLLWRFRESCERLEFGSLGSRLLSVPLVVNLELFSPDVLPTPTARIFTEVFEWSIDKGGDRSRNFLPEILDITWVWVVNVSEFGSVFMVKRSLFYRQIFLLSVFEVIKKKHNFRSKTVAGIFQKSFPGFGSSCYLVVEVDQLEVVNLA